MTTIGFATLQIIPSLQGVSDSVNKQLGGALDGKKFGKTFGKDIAAGMKASESDVKRAMDGYSKLYDKQKDALGKVAAEQSKLNDLQAKGISGGRLVTQSERLEKAKRDEARALREARDAYKEYESAAKSAAGAGDKVGDKVGGGLLDKIKGLAGSAKSGGAEAAGGFVEGFGGPIASLGTKAGPIGLALAAAAALGVVAGGLIAKQVFAGMEQEQQRANVAAQLGLDPAAMKPIADASAKAYASNFGESVASNMDAARIAIQTGLIGPDSGSGATEKLVEQLTTVSSILGEDIPSTARAAQQAIRTGLAPNATAAFDLIVKGQQAGLNTSQDFLDTLNEYGTQFRKLGLAGPEAVGLISQAMKGGARDSDVAADALKEFSIRAVDGSKTTVDGFTKIGLNADEMASKFAQGGQSAHDGLAQVLDGLRNIQDPVEQSRVAVELFGTQAEDLGGAFKNFDLSNAVNQLGQVDGAAQKASDTMGNTTAGSFESAKRSIEVAADGMQQSLAKAFGPGLEQLAGWVTAHQDEIVHWFQIGADAGAKFGGVVIGATGGVVQAFGYMVEGIGDGIGFVLDGFEQLARGAAVVAGAVGQDGLAAKLNDAANTLGNWSDTAHGAGEDIVGFGQTLSDAGLQLFNFDASLDSTAGHAQTAGQRAQELANIISALPGAKNIDISAIVVYKDTAGVVIPPDQLRAPVRAPAVPGDTYRGPGRAGGGSIFGPGTATSDSVPIMASHGEHMWTAAEVNSVGGQANMYRLRALARKGAFRSFAGGGAMDFWKLADPRGFDPHGGSGGEGSLGPFAPWWDMDWLPPEHPGAVGETPGGRWWHRGPTETGGAGGGGKWAPPLGKERKPLPGQLLPRWLLPDRIKMWGFKDGGAIGPDVQAAGELVGTAYSQANRTDCSGMVARVVDRTLGMPETGLMSTKNAKEWLAARGFKPGLGGPGQISVGWYDHGPNPNDGHMSMTLSDGTPAEAGGGVGDIFQIGGGAAGASDPQFDQHMFLPTVWGEGPAGSGSASPFAGGSAAAAITGGAGAPAISSGGGTTSSSGGGSGFSLPSSIGGLASFGLSDLGKGVGTTGAGSDLSLFGNAAASAVSGQVDSALGVLGVNGSPGWLKAISTLVGGISIGGKGSADPLSASPSGTGTPPPDDPGNMHGGRAGQPPGPQVVINARDTEDAFIKYDRYQKEKAAAKLSRF